MKFKGLRFAMAEIWHASAGTVMKVVMVAIGVIPLLDGGLYLTAFLDPYENLNTVPVAVVNAGVFAVMRLVWYVFGPERLIYGSDFPIFRMKARRVVENGFYINEIPEGSLGDAAKKDAHLREIPYPEAEKITFFIYEEIDSCRRACEKLGLGKADVEKIFYANSARIFGVE